MNTCLNCGAQIRDNQKYCDYLCSVGYTNKQVKEFNETYKPALTYTDITQKEILENENKSRKELEDRYTNGQ